MKSWELLHIGQAEVWRKMIDQLEDADIYYTPEFCKVYEESENGQAHCFVYREDESIICYPFLIRKIPSSLQRNKGLAGEYYDIITPYGYGGPISNVTNPEHREKLFRRFETAFDDFCRENSIVSEFVRFHPIICNHEDYSAVQPIFERNTVYIDLRLSGEEILRNFSRKSRNRIRKAVNEGLTISSAGRDVERFAELYYATMDKLNANSYYYFPKHVFSNTTEWLKDHIEIVEIKLGSEVILSCMFLHYNRYLHYHLTGSREEYLHMAPTNLLIDHAVKWGKEKGYSYLHLGGGYSGNDTLYRYKKNFNESDDLKFFVGKRVRDEYVYARLTEGLDAESYGSFFPLYRHPKLNSEKAIAL